jgi:glycosyltransferase involved in cell wall biosynthesis
MLPTSNKILFNFSASIGGGGLKRLDEYSRWFDGVGGSNFIVAPSTNDYLVSKYPNNKYFKAKQSLLDRVFRDQSYLNELPINLRSLELYFSYGIPIYSKIAKKNWFHISNVAPFANGVEKSIKDLIRLPILKYRFLNNLDIPDFISAESQSSFRYLPSKYKNKFICLFNGSDDEIVNFNKDIKKQNYAVSVGTHPYKRIDRVIDCFNYFKKDYGLDELLIFGESEIVNKNLHNKKNVKFMGLQDRNSVINSIASSKFYISCTTIENSFNAASEGIFLSENSVISDIGPHRELLMSETKESITINDQKMFMVKKDLLKCKNIMTWDSVIKIMLNSSGLKI